MVYLLRLYGLSTETLLSPQIMVQLSAVEAEVTGTTSRIAVNELCSADIMTFLFKESEVSALLPF